MRILFLLLIIYTTSNLLADNIELDKSIAVVNSEVITLSIVAQSYQIQKIFELSVGKKVDINKIPYPMDRKIINSILNKYIIYELVHQETRRISPQKRETNSLNIFKKKFKTEDDFKKFLKKLHITENFIKSFLFKKSNFDSFIKTKININKIIITNDEIQKLLIRRNLSNSKKNRIRAKDEIRNIKYQMQLSEFLGKLLSRNNVKYLLKKP